MNLFFLAALLSDLKLNFEPELCFAGIKRERSFSLKKMLLVSAGWWTISILVKDTIGGL